MRPTLTTLTTQTSQISSPNSFPASFFKINLGLTLKHGLQPHKATELFSSRDCYYRDTSNCVYGSNILLSELVKSTPALTPIPLHHNAIFRQSSPVSTTTISTYTELFMRAVTSSIQLLVEKTSIDSSQGLPVLSLFLCIHVTTMQTLF